MITIFLYEKPEETVVEISTHPIFLREFFITPEQVGLTHDVHDYQSATLQAENNKEVISLLLDHRKSSRHAYEERKARRLRAFTAGPSYSMDRPDFSERPCRRKPDQMAQSNPDLFTDLFVDDLPFIEHNNAPTMETAE
ncbi:hypothetical protein BYT27DRAFT_7252588 [Phlegmacium glaucopus]|nr:hypothetical protein BYT27DRAFT_7252588 [Phlegmacium glaucopus]